MHRMRSQKFLQKKQKTKDNFTYETSLVLQWLRLKI